MDGATVPVPDVGAVAAALCMASVGSEFYLVTLLLQTMRGDSPVRAGFAFLPLAACVTVGSTVTGRLVRRFGVTVTLATGSAWRRPGWPGRSCWPGPVRPDEGSGPAIYGAVHHGGRTTAGW